MSDLSRNQILELALQVGAEDIGPYWTAFETRLGIMVFADSKEDAVNRLRTAIDFTINSIIDGEESNLRHLQAYLKRYDVKYIARDNDRPSWVLKFTLDPEATLVGTG